jgi:hypothetical protein
VPSAMTTLSGLQTCRKVGRFANDAALLRLFRSDQVAAERPSHHTFELAAQRTFQIETIWLD